MTMTVAIRQPGKINQLTSLRFFAAFSVLIYHFRGMLLHASLASPEGYIGVTFFYILSGFIISYNYTDKLNLGALHKADYLAFRISRIWPLHLVTLLLSFPIYLFTVAQHNIGITEAVIIPVVNLLLLQSWIPSPLYYFSMNAASWSISNEMFFYVFFLFIVGWSTKKLGVLFILGLCTVIAASTVIFMAYGSPRWATWLFYVNPVARCMDFVCGILLYRIYTSNLSGHTYGSRAECCSIFALIIMTAVIVIFDVPAIFRYDIAFILPLAFMVLCFSSSTGIFSRLLNNRVLIVLGESSFALYMIHHPIITYCSVVFGLPENTIQVIVYALLLVPLCIGVSVLTHFYIERPLTKVVRARWHSRWRQGFIRTD